MYGGPYRPPPWVLCHHVPSILNRPYNIVSTRCRCARRLARMTTDGPTGSGFVPDHGPSARRELRRQCSMHRSNHIGLLTFRGRPSSTRPRQWGVGTGVPTDRIGGMRNHENLFGRVWVSGWASQNDWPKWRRKATKHCRLQRKYFKIRIEDSW